MVISIIAPVTVAGILIMAILAATANAQESNGTENSQESNNTASPSGSTASNNTASPSGSMVNSGTGSAQQSNNTGNGPTSQESSNTRNARQENNGTENAISPGVPCPYNANITCSPRPEPLNGTNTNTTSTPYVVNKNSSAYLVGYNDAISYGNANVTCLSLSNTSSVQNDCGSGYVDGINKLGDPTFQQTADFIKGMLTAHNHERHLVGVTNDLVWDKDLAASAKAWAEHLSPAGELVHDYGNVEAENIADSLSNGPRLWINEKNDYHGDTCASGKECGHYLNMVSPRLSAVGCGTAPNPHDIVVCRYRK